MGDASGFSNADPWASDSKKPTSEDTDSDDFFPPLSSLSKPAVDPWTTNLAPAATIKPPQTNGALFNTNSLMNPWSSSSNTSTNTNSSNSPSNILSLNKDPWSTQVNPPMQNKLDDFDLFTSNRATVSSPTKQELVSDPFGDFFGTSSNSANINMNTNSITTTSPVSSDLFSNNSSTNPWNSAKSGPMNPTRKTPESFLGENSALVNLENLIPSTQTSMAPSLTQRPKSTNPFGANNNMSNQPLSSMTTSNSSTQLNNPFMSQQQLMNQKGPTISQMQNQSAFPSFTAANTTAYSGLAQPLIVPPALMPLPFNNFNNQTQSLFPAANSANTQTSMSGTTTATNPFLMM